MKNLLNLILALLFTNTFSVRAQKFKDESGSGYVVGSVGVSTLFLADIGDPIKEQYIYSAKYGFGINTEVSVGFKQFLTNDLAYKILFQRFEYGREDKNDKENKYSFNSNFNQISAKLVANIYKLNTPKFSAVYLDIGIGYLYGTAIKNNHQIAPKDTVFTTNNSLKVFSLPIGVGYKINLSRKLSLSVESEMNYFFSGKIDGKEESGSIWPQDIGTSISFTLSYRLFDRIKIEKKCNCDWD